MPSRPLTRRQAVLAAGLGLPAAVIGASIVGERSRPRPSPARPRDVRLVVDADVTTEGAGVRLRRALGTRALSMFDPFLLLDEMHSDRQNDYEAGFPTHPHRGFETVTYVIEGCVDHRDSMDNHGHLGPGSAQWMTAGHGIEHSEMPSHEPGNTRLWGFQLWVNLPSSLKMMKPRYQDLPAERIPELTVEDATVRLVAGDVLGVRGPVEGIVTAPTMLDVTIPRKGRFSHRVDEGHSTFAYVIDGAVEVGPSLAVVRQGQLAVLGAGDSASARSQEGGRMLLLAARPIREPVARSGPFVMNTQDELRQAWNDYRAGHLVDG